MKRLIGLILIGVLMFSCISIAYAASSFSDVKSTNWAYEAVNTMSEKGILKGYADGTFKPNNNVTYGEFIKMALIGATNQDVGNSSTGNWALSYYDKALELKYFTASQIDKSQLNNPIPRGDMALIISSVLYSLYGETQVEVTTTDGTIILLNYDNLKGSMKDVTSTTKNKDEIVKSYATGILTGYPDGSFKPVGTLSRAEATTVINRLVDESKRELPKVSQPDLTNSGDIDKILAQKTNNGTTMSEFLGVKNAEELKEKKPITYYSYLSLEDKNINEIITNLDYMKSVTFDCKYYKIVDMKDIGFNSINITKDKFNSEQIEVTPGDSNTQAFLIKDKKIVCELDSGRSSSTSPITFYPSSDIYYNGNYQNNKLMEYDYIGFWAGTGDTVFLVKKTW